MRQVRGSAAAPNLRLPVLVRAPPPARGMPSVLDAPLFQRRDRVCSGQPTKVVTMYALVWYGGRWKKVSPGLPEWLDSALQPSGFRGLMDNQSI